ncbi:MAG: hypothetical protein U9Q89_05055 [Thermodesulfobacteriota bacterium]|nr:hypothetical protein [Thermodesulfobacteriota bacterium]
MRRRLTIWILALTLVGAFSFIGCDKKEEAGVEKVKQDVSEMAEEGAKATEQEGALETVGEKVEEAAGTVEEKVEGVAGAVEETTEEAAGTVEEKAEEAAEAVTEKAEEAVEAIKGEHK